MGVVSPLMDGTRARAASQPWLKFVARLGYAARGVVYLIVGAIALAAVIGWATHPTGTRGALESMLDHPFGWALLGAVALGLLAHAVWRFFQSVFDADDHGSGAKGLTLRGGLLVSSLSHLVLAITAASLAIGWSYPSGDPAGDGGTRDWTARLMSQPLGRWAVGLIGTGLIGAGVAQFIKGYDRRYERWLDLSPAWQRTISPICRFGLIARAVVFGIVGALLIVAAVQYDANEARGLGGALQTLRGQPYGAWLLAVMAAGLIAFAAYSFVQSGARRVHSQ